MSVGLAVLVILIVIAVIVVFYKIGTTSKSITSVTTSISTSQNYTNSSIPHIENYKLISLGLSSEYAPTYLDSGLVGGDTFTFSSTNLSSELLLIRVLTYGSGAFAMSTYQNLTSPVNSSDFGEGATLTYLSNLPVGVNGTHLVTPAQNVYSITALHNSSVITVTLSFPQNASITDYNAVSTLLNALNATLPTLR